MRTRLKGTVGSGQPAPCTFASQNPVEQGAVRYGGWGGGVSVRNPVQQVPLVLLRNSEKQREFASCAFRKAFRKGSMFTWFLTLSLKEAQPLFLYLQQQLNLDCKRLPMISKVLARRVGAPYILQHFFASIYLPHR